MADIAPEMYEKIANAFARNMNNDKTLQHIMDDLRAGKVTPEAMAHAAEHVGESAANAFKTVITPDALPNGQMYYNIAKRTVEPEMRAVFDEINDICIDAQKIANDAAGIGLNPVPAQLNQSRIDGIIERLCAQPFADIDWILDEPIINFAQNVHNDFVQENAGFQRSAGLSPKITRRVVGSCCDWCEGLAGSYDYGEQPDDFFRMHDYCRCVIVFEPSKRNKRGRFQNSTTKEWYEDSEELVKERVESETRFMRKQKKTATETKQKAVKAETASRRGESIQEKVRKERAKLTVEQEIKLTEELKRERIAAVNRAGGEDAVRAFIEKQKREKEAIWAQLLKTAV